MTTPDDGASRSSSPRRRSLASAVLIAGRSGTAGLYVGRLLTVVVSGTCFTVWTAWVSRRDKEAVSGPAAGRLGHRRQG